MAQLLNDQIQQQLKELFANLKQPVHILFFGAKENCAHCTETHQLVEEVCAIADPVSFSAHDIDDDAEVAELFHVDKTPGLVIAAKDDEQIIDYGVRFAGIPSGHEFNSFVNSILAVSARDSGLADQTRQWLANLAKPVHLQVFVTPT